MSRGQRAILAAVAMVAAVAGARAASAPAGTIVEISGRGEYRQSGAIDWRAAQVRQSLFSNDYVRSLHLSRVTILFADGARESLGANGVLHVREVAVDGKGKTILEQLQGKSWGSTKTTPDGLEIRTRAGTASIRGTEWEIDVEGDSATLSVFEGEVDFFNAHGAVVVHANEQARAELGRAPVKLQVRVSRSRMQWVSSATVDPETYAEFRSGHAGALSAIADLLRDGRMADAHALVQRHLAGSAPSAVGFLLAADFEVYSGELAAAADLLRRGTALYPADERFDAALARIALLDGEPALARRHVESALAKRADSLEALIMLGDLEKHEGHAQAAVVAYTRATAAASRDPRGWRGLGIVETERENVRRARSHLLQALELDDAPGTRAELGTLESFGGNLAVARARMLEALAKEPGNYVALTGLGIVELKSGSVRAALDALLAATAIEPRYARAQVYLAAAYYHAGREEAAIATLRRASEIDPKDPLPHLLLSIVHLDRFEPGDAAIEARDALRRLPFAKSLNQVSDNQKGIASVGAPLAFMGLEGWARSEAHDSYLPFWGASHLFLADRYPGEFDRRSELMQGLVVDPLALGGSNRFQPLVQSPGRYATLSLRAGGSDDLWLREPVLTLAGLATAPFPWAWFAEVIDTRIEPRDADVRARAQTFSAAAGARPAHEVGLFLYANHVDADVDSGRADATGTSSRVRSRATRIDAGVRYASDPQSMLMLKAGASEETSSLDQAMRLAVPGQVLSQASAFSTRPTSADVSVRHIHVAGPLELAWGVEAASRRAPISLALDATLHFEGSPAARTFLEQQDRDRSHAIQAQARWSSGALLVEAGAAWQGYRKDRDIDVNAAPGPVHLVEGYRREGVNPHAGITWAHGEATRLRAACRRWLRPASLDTLVPVSVAGMPLEDQLVLAGGRMGQCRAQADWGVDRVFAAVHVERIEISNLVSPLDGPLNARLDVTNLDRLRNRTLTAPAKPDQLEDLAIFGEGIVRSAGATLEAMITRRIGLRASYTWTNSENTGAQFRGLELPYLARDVAALGLTWSPGNRVSVKMDAVRRSTRHTDEANSVALAPGWDAQARIYWETNDKHWSVEAFAANLLRKDSPDVFGIVASYRF